MVTERKKKFVRSHTKKKFLLLRKGFFKTFKFGFVPEKKKNKKKKDKNVKLFENYHLFLNTSLTFSLFFSNRIFCDFGDCSEWIHLNVRKTKK